MQVFLIPIGGDQYEPYFEPPDGTADEEPAPAGWFGRLRRRFSEMLREAEEERHRRHDLHADDGAGRMARWRRRLMRWVVERAAEQRLLWHLRTATQATLHVPDDLAASDALSILRLGLRRDGERHRVWFVVHLVLLILSGVFFFVPGPNLIGYFFTFTTVGHLLAWRGATHGLRDVTWETAPNADLRELRFAEAGASDREARVHAAAERLGLRHLATFVERLAAPPA